MYLKPEAWFCLGSSFICILEWLSLALENKEHAVCSNKMTWVQNAPKSQAAVAHSYRGKGGKGFSWSVSGRKIRDPEYVPVPAGVQLQQPGIQPEGMGGVGEKLRQPLSFFGLTVYFKLMILFYTFTKALDQRFDIFSSHWPRFIFLQKSLLPLKRNSFLSDSLIYFFSCVLVNTL